MAASQESKLSQAAIDKRMFLELDRMPFACRADQETDHV